MNRICKLFVETYKNDSFINRYELLKGSTLGHLYIARLSFIPRSLSESKIVCFAIKLFFPFVFLFVILSYFAKSIVKITLSKKTIISESNVFLLMSNALLKAVHRCNIPIENAVCLRLDGIDVKFDTCNDVGVYRLVSVKECVRAFFYSFCVLPYTYQYNDGECILLSLNCYKWFLYYFAANTIPSTSTIYFCNQKDRWSLLADALPHNSKVLIQHGTELLIHPSPSILGCSLHIQNIDSWVMNMPYKLSSISKVYSFTEKEGIGIKCSILDCNPEFVCSGYGLSLSHIESVMPKVLIISLSSVYAEREESIVNMLSKYNITIIVKNHPTQNPEVYYKLGDKYHFIFINEMIFPDADLVISYDSTLALEYQSLGIDVIYHVDMSNDELARYVENKFSICPNC